MKKKLKSIELAQIVKTFLDETFPNPKPTLVANGPFQWLIAAMLSANCTDRAVNGVTKVLFKILKHPSDISNIDVSGLERIISSCGLFRKKSKAIIGICNLLNEKFEGEVPSDISKLMLFPLVGRKVALVVLSMAFNIPSFPVDTHIFRCARRWGLSNGKTREKVESDLCLLFPVEEWIKTHLQIIYYGRAYCSSRHLSECIICDYIRTFNASLIKSKVV